MYQHFNAKCFTLYRQNRGQLSWFHQQKVHAYHRSITILSKVLHKIWHVCKICQINQRFSSSKISKGSSNIFKTYLHVQSLKQIIANSFKHYNINLLSVKFFIFPTFVWLYLPQSNIFHLPPIYKLVFVWIQQVNFIPLSVIITQQTSPSCRWLLTIWKTSNNN